MVHVQLLRASLAYAIVNDAFRLEIASENEQ